LFISKFFEPHEDHSATFAAIRSDLYDADGTPLTALIKDLKPDYGQVWRDLALGYSGLVWSAASTVWFAQYGLAGALLGMVCGAGGIGFWIAYIQLFIHEGAHANLASSRKTSDLICDLFVGWLIGTSVRKYRKVHFEHHRAFGTTGDSENTYFRALNAAFIVKALTGWRVIEVLTARARLTAPKAKVGTALEGADRDRIVLLGGIAAHLAILAALFLTGGWAAALAWVAGVGVVFPFLGALRQLLEHRSLEAQSAADYSVVDHGGYTRLFGTGVLARTFGAAGFNRHLLHHWEPSVSYTCFDALEDVFVAVGMGPAMDARRTTYGAAFRALYNRR
jgi:fatty acid desaturase